MSQDHIIAGLKNCLTGTVGKRGSKKSKWALTSDEADALLAELPALLTRSNLAVMDTKTGDTWPSLSQKSP